MKCTANTGTILKVVVAFLAPLVLTTCQPAVSPEELLRVGDRIKPTITITSHQDGEQFLEPATTITGTIIDAAKDDGTAGRVASSTWVV